MFIVLLRNAENKKVTPHPMHLNSNQQPFNAFPWALRTPVRPSPVWPGSPGPSLRSSNLHLFSPFAGHLCCGSHTCPPHDVPVASSSLFSPRSNATSSRKPPWTTFLWVIRHRNSSTLLLVSFTVRVHLGIYCLFLHVTCNVTAVCSSFGAGTLWVNPVCPACRTKVGDK